MWPSGKAPGFGLGIPRFESWHLRFLRFIIRRIKILEGIASIILAGGKGERMKSDLPKVLHPLRGRPLISHVTESLRSAGIDDIYIVVGFKGDAVIDALGPSFHYVWQRQQLGTGHAVMQAESAFEGYTGRIIVACGDVPLIRPATFRKLVEMSDEPDVKAAVLTMKLENPFGYGRIITDGTDGFVRIVEEKDASPEEKLVSEVNTGTYIFDREYLFSGLKRINNSNAQGEYYLPDVLQYIRESGCNVRTYCLEDPLEGSGINSREELARVEKYIDNGNLGL